MLRGQLHAAAGHEEAALRDAREAIAQDPKLPGAAEFLASLQLTKGDLRGAFTTLDSAAKAGTLGPAGYVQFGNLYRRLGNDRLAIHNLEKALAAGRRATARAAVEVLGRTGGAEVIDSLAAALEVEDDKLVVAAADALGATGDAAAEAPLIAALDRDGPTVWPAIAAALGLVGTAAAVAPLRTMAGRFPFDLGLRRASRQAIAEIQSRLTGATPGQLALADGDAGQLSLAEEGLEGRVSMAAEDDASAGVVDDESEAADSAAEGAVDDESQWPTDTQGDESGEDASEPPTDTDEPPAGSMPRPHDRRETE